ncbi:uncharacterized protein [Halyomorpha halys]|uniref:uncharacterized protein n=1 Tax=Halyomorpha halys TaxID=286706 RepID=UPI0006D4CE07|nr:uncharacterized protein LOC106685919 [Halyomorpha halys]XP_014284411.1 uncharacterized protein LOC106685919 [Halyomorpha halys]XP_014284412.1 uncharacterized protein LOC106685919 [Halyomorpha halys]XP_024214715.1 uncharacterized protein LOC106685919 [Halyomorpha halys]
MPHKSNEKYYVQSSEDELPTHFEPPKQCQERQPDPMIHFKLIVIWQLDEKYVSVKKHIISLPWTRNLQIFELYERVSRLYPFWNREEFRMYGRCGDLYLPIKNYITLTATLRHMATYSSDLLYLVRSDVVTETMMTVEDLRLRWHVRERQRERADIKIIKKWVGNQGYEGRNSQIRGEHAPPTEYPVSYSNIF